MLRSPLQARPYRALKSHRRFFPAPLLPFPTSHSSRPPRPSRLSRRKGARKLGVGPPQEPGGPARSSTYKTRFTSGQECRRKSVTLQQNLFRHGSSEHRNTPTTGNCCAVPGDRFQPSATIGSKHTMRNSIQDRRTCWSIPAAERIAFLSRLQLLVRTARR